MIVKLYLLIACDFAYSFSFRSDPVAAFKKKNWSVKAIRDGNDANEISRKALRNLLERQRRELLDTENLLKGLEYNLTMVIQDNSSFVQMSAFPGCDYGFCPRSEGCQFDLKGSFGKNTASYRYGPPANILALGIQQFNRNLSAMRGEYLEEDSVALTFPQTDLQEKLKKLTLSSNAIWEREKARGFIDAPLVIKIPYLLLCFFLDILFEGKYVPARFFYLETVARMPYFSYITMLHLYETLGFWRRSADVKRVHFSQEWNEFNHLLIMESLGGDQLWWVRFMAQHSAIIYFVVLTVLWALSPSLSYKFSELLETHAVDTYDQFLYENEALLKDLPPSYAAVEYYTSGIVDPLFGEYQSSTGDSSQTRRVGIDMRSLYDVFVAIRADEGDHVSTMKSCLDQNIAMISKLIIGTDGTNNAADLTKFAATAENFDAAVFNEFFASFSAFINGVRVEENEAFDSLVQFFTDFMLEFL